MDNDILFFKLRDCLAELYPDQETARIIAIEAGLDERHIAFSGRAQTNWHHILAEAIKTCQVNVLLATVSNAYPAFPPFRAAYSDYLDAGSTLTLPGNKDKPLSPSHKLLHNLPHPDYEKFIGRQKELEQIRRLLLPYPHSRHWVVTIDGVGGIGKSALALEIAHSFCWGADDLPEAERFDAIIWTTAKQTKLFGDGIHLHSHALHTISDIYTTIADILDRPDIKCARGYEQADLIRQALAEQRTLLLIDNLETVDDEQVLSFIRDLPDPTKVIVTTRHRLDIAYPIRVEGLNPNEGMELIENETRRRSVKLSNNEARQLVTKIGAVPLAIVWSLAQIGFGYSVNTVLTRLDQSDSDIAKFCFSQGMAIISESPAEQLLLALSLFIAGGSREALGQITGLSESERDDGLVQLEKLSLANKYEDRFDLLPLTKNFVLGRLKAMPDVESRLKRAFIGYFLEFCTRYGGDQWRLYSNLDAELNNIRLAVEWAYQFKMWREVGQFVDGIAEYLDRRGPWDEQVEYSKIAVEAGRKLNDKYMIARHKTFGLGFTVATKLGDYETGLESIEEGLNLALELKLEHQYAIALANKGYVLGFIGEYGEAIKFLQEALQMFQQLVDSRWEIRTLGFLGRCALNHGMLDDSLLYHSEALSLAERTGDLEQIALCTRRLGEIYLHKNRFEDARSAAKKSKYMYDQINYITYIPICQLLVARTEYALGNLDTAKTIATEAYNSFVRLRYKPYIIRSEQLLEMINTEMS